MWCLFHFYLLTSLRSRLAHVKHASKSYARETFKQKYSCILFHGSLSQREYRLKRTIFCVFTFQWNVLFYMRVFKSKHRKKKHPVEIFSYSHAVSAWNVFFFPSLLCVVSFDFREIASAMNICAQKEKFFFNSIIYLKHYLLAIIFCQLVRSSYVFTPAARTRYVYDSSLGLACSFHFTLERFHLPILH